MTNPHREASQDLECFLTTPAPREVPRAIEIAASTRETGRAVFVVGLFLFLLGLVQSISFFPTNLSQRWRLEKGPVQTVTGVIDQVEQFPTRKGRTDYRYHYHFQPAGQPPQQGVAYSSNLAWTPGSVIWIDYLTADPALSVPKSGRVSLDDHPVTIAFPLALAALGLILTVIGVRSIRARRRILRVGQTTTGLVTEVEPTLVRISGRTQRRITLIRGDNGRKVTRRTHHLAEINFLTERVGTDQTVTLLYDPADPKRVLIPDAWGR